MGSEDGTSNADNSSTDCGEGVKCLKTSNGVEIAEEGIGIVEGASLLKSEAISNGVEIADGNGATGEILLLKSEAITNGVEIADGNGIAEEVPRLKVGDISNGVPIAGGNGVAEETLLLKSEAIGNGVGFAYGNGVTEETRCLKSEAISNGVAISDGFDSADRDSSGIECLRTYKRRKHVKSSSENKVQKDYRQYVEVASHVADQAVKKPSHVAIDYTSDGSSHGHWGNIVLKHLYQSLGDGHGGLKECIREAIMHHHEIRCAAAPTVMGQETSKSDKDGQGCSSQLEWSSQRTRSEANGHENVMHNGCSSEPFGPGMTEMCLRVLCNTLASEKFSSLCKVLLENFQGMKPEKVFDFGVMNSRMKEHTYEESPALFLSDIQQVWIKLQDTGNEIVSLAKSLSNISRMSYSELFHNHESDPHMKPEQPEECDTYKVCICRHCGDKAYGMGCLVCDSCDAMYHVSCIVPPVKEIPHKSWYCANCTACGSGSMHDNCVVCEKLDSAKTLNNMIGEESFPKDEETLNELEENSNCAFEGVQTLAGEKNPPNCKRCGNDADGEKTKICGHPFCSNKYYHVRCLTSKQLQTFGRCWYCPSCLCRVCLTDKDDDKIVLCDGCDYAYHIYCMNPPRSSIPRRKWFCRKCDAGIQAIRRAKKKYRTNQWRTGEDVLKSSANLEKSNKQRSEEDVSKSNAHLEKKSDKKRVRDLEKGGGMDMLLSAANSLHFEENLVEIPSESQRT